MKNTFRIRDDQSIWNKSTLAHFLDNRPISFGEPSQDDLPETVVPLELLRGLTGQHLSIVRIKDSAETQDLFAFLPLLKHLVPAGKQLIVFRELEPSEDRTELSFFETDYIAEVLDAEDRLSGAVHE